ncbi:MAG: DUF2075 domain-containing protein [Chloroflexi bacterium]|nr:DUF2075 domain-containing protein [Chloroflexota bacterium]
MDEQLISREQLQDEQPKIVDVAVRSTPDDEFIFVQGVAGSGKTTIALRIIYEIGKRILSAPEDNRRTVIFLTYNNLLVEKCYKRLKDESDITNIIADDHSKIVKGQINIMAVSDFLRLCLDLDERTIVKSDKDCIEFISSCADYHGIDNLLPPQIFALITSFLRGRKELCNLSIEKLNEYIDEHTKRDDIFRIYGKSIRNIRQIILKKYEDWKKSGRTMDYRKKGSSDKSLTFFDRSDVAKNARESLMESEKGVEVFLSLDDKKLRTFYSGQLEDKGERVKDALDWITQVFLELQKCPGCGNFDQCPHAPASMNDEFRKLSVSFLDSIPNCGLRATSTWDTIGSNCNSPIILVDEIQDLSPIEIEDIISIWFQLPRTKESRLIFLGDSNQQITPTGFKWEDLFELINQKAEIYHFSKKFLHIEHLWKNYRTTKEIANFVNKVFMNIVPNALKDYPPVKEKFEDNIIKPGNTFELEKLAVKKLEIILEQGDVLPHFIVGDDELLKRGFEKYIRDSKGQNLTSDTNNNQKTTMVISERFEDAKDYVTPELLGNGEIKPLEVIRVLDCKGLEYDRCIIHGLCIKENGELEPDLISRWYTAFTRAKLLLMIYVNPEEAAFLKNLGWNNFAEDDVYCYKENLSVDAMALELKRIGKTELDRETCYRLASKNFSKFKDRIHGGNKEDLSECLRYCRLGKLATEELDYAKEGAQIFEAKKDYLNASDYYLKANLPVDAVRCLVLQADRTSLSDSADHINSAEKVTTHFVSKVEDKSRCYILLRNYSEALSWAELSEEPNFFRERKVEVIGSVKGLSRNSRDKALSHLKTLRTKNYLDVTALCYLHLSEWEDAFDCAKEAGKAVLDDVASQAESIVFNVQPTSEIDVEIIAGQLSKNNYYEKSARVKLKIKDFAGAVQEYVKSGNMDAALKVSKTKRISPAQKSEIHNSLAFVFRREPNTWDQAYYHFNYAEQKNECKKIEHDCRKEQEYRILLSCFIRTKKYKQVVSLANELLKIKSDLELIAECQEKAELWENAVKAWMELADENIRKFQFFFGPNPNENLVQDDWEKFKVGVDKNWLQYLSPEDCAKWEELRKYQRDPQTVFINISKTIAMISQSSEWQNQINDFLKVVQETVRRFSEYTEINYAINLPLKSRVIGADQVKIYWNNFVKDNCVFSSRAVEICRELYAVGSDSKILAMTLMQNTCKRKDDAKNMLDNLLVFYPHLWVDGCKTLSITSYDDIKHMVFSLHLLDQANQIIAAINALDHPKYSEYLRIEYKRRLKNDISSKAQAILARHFDQPFLQNITSESTVHVLGEKNTQRPTLISSSSEDVEPLKPENVPLKIIKNGRLRIRKLQIGKTQAARQVLQLREVLYLDFHGYEKQAAVKMFDARLIECSKNTKIGILLVQHGAGNHSNENNKSAIIKRWLRSQTPKIESSYPVKVYFGEKLTTDFKTQGSILEIVGPEEINKYGNPYDSTHTFFVFNRD